MSRIFRISTYKSANLSKNKAKLEQAGDDEKKKESALAMIQKWETTKKAIEEEIEARKKK